MLLPLSAMAISDNSYFTAKTVEGIDMTFYVRKVSDGVCMVSDDWPTPAIDKSTTGSVTIPSEVEGLKVTEIGFGAFCDCTGITSVSIPNTITEISSFSFAYCKSLETINIPNTVTRLGDLAFSWCTSLETITGIASLEYVGEYAFNNTPWYDNLPDGLIYIGRALYEYKGTMPDNTSVTVKEGTKSITKYAFWDCEGLTSINIPASVIEVGYGLFAYCPNLASITVTAGNEKYDSRSNCNAIVETSTNTVVAGCKDTTFPSTVKAIGNYAFYDCMGLTSIVIPNNIEKLGDGCFKNCTSLESVVIGNGLKYIDSGECFAYCDNLKLIEIVSSNPYLDSREGCNAIIETATNILLAGCPGTVIPNTVTAIGYEAFHGCSNMTRIDIPNSVEKIDLGAFECMYGLEYVTIGSGVTEIGRYAFFGDSKITTIWCKVDFPFDLNENVFDDEVYDNATLYVPVGSRINYMTSIGWNRFKNIVETDTEPTTDVSVAKADQPSKAAPVYSLSGQRLSQPQKGINIIGGKKVVVK